MAASSNDPVAMGIPVAESTTAMADTSYPERPAAAFHRSNTEASLHALTGKGYPLGLIAALRGSLEAFPLRIWIVDNSGSMASSDGCRFVKRPGTAGGSASYKKVTATRWAELEDVVIGIGELTTALGVRTDFHLLNPPAAASQFVSLGPSDAAGTSAPPAAGKSATLDELKRVMATSPTGGTPLDASVHKICDMVEPKAEKLRAHGQKVVVVIATDGLPNDRVRFISAMQRLQALPVWTVVRLCTDDGGVTEYYSNLDKDLEAPLEVLDDICGEAQEVKRVNGFLSYGPPLHQLREWGLHEKLFDTLDEQRMLPSQVKQFVELTLGCKPLPDPDADAEAFLKAVEEALKFTPPTFDPLLLHEAPWFDMGRLREHVTGGGGGGCAIL